MQQKNRKGSLWTPLSVSASLAVLLTCSSGCVRWRHHLKVHSLFSKHDRVADDRYYHCSHCGKIIPEEGASKCPHCLQVPAFHGYEATCWRQFPSGWGCPPERLADQPEGWTEGMLEHPTDAEQIVEVHEHEIESATEEIPAPSPSDTRPENNVPVTDPILMKPIPGAKPVAKKAIAPKQQPVSVKQQPKATSLNQPAQVSKPKPQASQSTRPKVAKAAPKPVTTLSKPVASKSPVTETTKRTVNAPAPKTNSVARTPAPKKALAVAQPVPPAKASTSAQAVSKRSAVTKPPAAKPVVSPKPAATPKPLKTPVQTALPKTTPQPVTLKAAPKQNAGPEPKTVSQPKAEPQRAAAPLAKPAPAPRVQEPPVEPKLQRKTSGTKLPMRRPATVRQLQATPAPVTKPVPKTSATNVPNRVRDLGPTPVAPIAPAPAPQPTVTKKTATEFPAPVRNVAPTPASPITPASKPVAKTPIANQPQPKQRPVTAKISDTEQQMFPSVKRIPLPATQAMIPVTEEPSAPVTKSISDKPPVSPNYSMTRAFDIPVRPAKRPISKVVPADEHGPLPIRKVQLRIDEDEFAEAEPTIDRKSYSIRDRDTKPTRRVSTPSVEPVASWTVLPRR